MGQPDGCWRLVGAVEAIGDHLGEHAFGRHVGVDERRGRDRERAVGRGVAHLHAHRARQLRFAAPGVAPDPVRPRIGERDPIGRAHQHHRIGERGLHLDAVAAHRHEARALAHHREALVAADLLDADDLEARPRVRPERGAHERHRQLGAVEQRLADVGAGGDEFRGRQIGDDALEPERQQLGALHAREAAVPVRQPLRRHGRERGQDHAHQRGRDQRLDQREAGDAPAPLCARAHCGWPPAQPHGVDLQDRPGRRLHPHHDGLRNPVGLLRIDEVGVERRTSTRQRWPATSPDKLPGPSSPRPASRSGPRARSRPAPDGRSSERAPRTVVAISEPIAASDTATTASATSTSISVKPGPLARARVHRSEQSRRLRSAS